MNPGIRTAALPALGLIAAILLGCGGGGGDSPTAVSDASATAPAPAAAPAVSTPAPAIAPAPAPAPAPSPAPSPADLTDAKNAIRLASALIEATYLANSYSTVKWAADYYNGRSSTSLSGCTSSIFTNADALPSVGDKTEINDRDCSRTIPDGSWVLSRKLLIILSSISDPKAPQFAAWTAGESFANTGSIAWDIPVTTNNYRFKGQGTFESTASFQVKHNADGTQQDSQTGWKIAAKGTDTTGAYDFMVDSSLACTYPSGQSTGTCTGGNSTLKGTLSGLPANATMVQTAASPPTFEITQGSQKLKVVRTDQSTAYTITTASGIPLVTSLLYLISGYY